MRVYFLFVFLFSYSLSVWAKSPPQNLPGVADPNAKSPQTSFGSEEKSAQQQHTSEQALSQQKLAAPGESIQKKTGKSQIKKEPSQEEAPKASKPGQGAVGEFVIKGEGKMSVDSDKPPLAIKMDENKALEPVFETEKELFQKNPSRISSLVDTAPVRQRSLYVITPRYFEFRQDAVAHEFHPQMDLIQVFKEPDLRQAQEKAYWDFKVADAHGRIFFSKTGKGMPPETIAIMTKNEKGETIRVGSPYSGLLTYWDSYGNQHTAISESFSLSGLVQRNPKTYVIFLALDHLFKQKEETEISGAGSNLLRETADWIKARGGANSPLTIQCYARSMDLAQEQADRVGEALTTLLKRSKGTLKGEGRTAASGLDERVEISVFSVQSE